MVEKKIPTFAMLIPRDYNNDGVEDTIVIQD
jgi:hypothetical protein